MDSRNNNTKIKKNIKNQSNSENISLEPQQYEKLKLKLMGEYNISSQEAESIIEDIVINKNEINIKKQKNKSKNDFKPYNLKEKDNSNINVIQNELSIENTSSASTKKQIQNNQIKTNQNNNQGVIFNPTNEIIHDEHNYGVQNQVNKKQDIDMIMESILPDYSQQVSIEVNHVDLTFEVVNEKVDSLKEKFIRTIKRDNSKKLKVHALKDISFKIYKGEKIGIIGYNGAGKSTLLSVITGVYPPDKGFVKTNGNISPMLSLGAGFDYNYSGRKNIFLNGAVLGYDKEFLESKVDEIIEFSELSEFIDIPIKNYSSGMIAKLGFSIATAVNPDILIIDEVLGVGDVNFYKKSRDKMKSLMEGGTTVLLVSHSVPQIRELCDKAIWIDNGRLREIGEVNEVCDHYLKDAEKASNKQLVNIQLK